MMNELVLKSVCHCGADENRGRGSDEVYFCFRFSSFPPRNLAEHSASTMLLQQDRDLLRARMLEFLRSATARIHTHVIDSTTHSG